MLWTANIDVMKEKIVLTKISGYNELLFFIGKYQIININIIS